MRTQTERTLERAAEVAPAEIHQHRELGDRNLFRKVRIHMRGEPSSLPARESAAVQLRRSFVAARNGQCRAVLTLEERHSMGDVACAASLSPSRAQQAASTSCAATTERLGADLVQHGAHLQAGVYG